MVASTVIFINYNESPEPRAVVVVHEDDAELRTIVDEAMGPASWPGSGRAIDSDPYSAYVAWGCTDVRN